jgi:POT family proton-dependent oligopeptide transporter
MAIALLVFGLGRREYINVPPSKTSAGFMAIFMEAIKNVSRRKPGQGFWEGAMPRYSREDIEGAQAAGRIFKVFITVSVFWALFDQNGSSWVLQAEKMDLDFWGMHIEASQLQAANPIMVMILIPFFAYVVYPLWGKYGPKVTPLRKMSVGMVLAAVSFVAVGLIQNAIDAGAHLNVMWQLVPYLILTASEVMVSITGLEFAYTQAPPSMKSTIMSFWLLTVFGGNMLVAYVARLNVFQGAGEFYFFAGLMFAVSFVFIWTASRYKTRDYIAHATGGH